MSSVLKAKLVHRDVAAQHSRHKQEIAGPPSESHGAEVLDQQIRVKAGIIEQEALTRADSIIDSAMKASRNVLEEARSQGFEEGYERGIIEGGQEAFIAIQERLDDIQKLADLLAEERHRALRQEDKTLITLAMEIAKKIMKKTAELEEDALDKMIEEVLGENEGKCKVVISEFQRTLNIKADKGLAKRLKVLSKSTSVVFVKEEDVLMVETATGVVDLSIPVQLEHLKQALDK